MEHMSSAHANMDEFGDLNAGTASDHFSMGVAHLRRSIQLAICGPGNYPASGADVSQQVVVPAESAASAGGDEDDSSSKAKASGVIIPTQQWKEIWDLVVLMFILYSAVMVPFRICFDASAVGSMFIFEQVVTISFLIDVCFNFNTAYLQDERWVTDRRLIAVRYFQGWFWIDAPSSVPVELIDAFLEGDSSSLGMLRFLRLFRLLRLLRLLKLGEYIAALEIKFDLNLTFLRICQMVVSLLFLAHMLGCFWFYCAALVGINDETTTWVSSYDDGSAMDADASTQYLYSVYWALTTLTTVGYGDITPTNNVERAYSLFALLVGALVFGFMLSSIGALVAALDRQAALSEERMDEIKEYMRWRQLPRDLVMRMRRYYTYYYSRKTAFDEQALLGALTPALRLEVVQYTLKETIGKIPLFASHMDPMFQMEIFPLLQPVSAAPKETIFNKGDPSQALFFLIKGQVEVISGVDGRVLYRIRPGSFFGESVITGRRRAATHRAATTCEMFCISNSNLGELFGKNARLGRTIYTAILREHVRKERMRNLSLRLLINRMERPKGTPPDPQMQQQAAAMRLQIAYNKASDRQIYHMADFDAEAPSEEVVEHSAPLLLGDSPGKTGKRPSHDASPTRDVSSHSALSKSESALLYKLDRLESYLAKIDVVQRTLPTSDNNRKKKSSNRDAGGA